MLPKTIELKNKRVFLIDQTLIPKELKIIEIKNIEAMYNAIKTMIVRGAPAIGVAAAAGMALYINGLKDKTTPIQKINKAGEYLISARPTAVNLSWAVNSILQWVKKQKDLPDMQKNIWAYVQQMADDDEATNRSIGNLGADLVQKNKKVAVLTHCNAGSLATVYWGTALGVIRELHNRGQLKMVYADETRPRMQGGKITSWELIQEKIPVTVITDNMAAHFMKQGLIDMVVVGADRIALNGDTANKIGTYNVAIIAKFHKIPFYVAAPVSTIDFNIKTGKEIIIEERGAEEVTTINGVRVMPQGVKVKNPAFDVTPAELISGIITEKVVISGDFLTKIASIR
ncbi:MAG: S-methyl-5-thioribose-1-phosphate isomerase [Candidatus Margulisbacteria bacterium]|nr:S-methyl-5-thioribose-1-phosphate isomerase [Candidatus Margulisiibacteriota bacterium]